MLPFDKNLAERLRSCRPWADVLDVMPDGAVADPITTGTATDARHVDAERGEGTAEMRGLGLRRLELIDPDSLGSGARVVSGLRTACAILALRC